MERILAKVQNTNQGCQWKIVKKIRKYLPNICIAIPAMKLLKKRQLSFTLSQKPTIHYKLT